MSPQLGAKRGSYLLLSVETTLQQHRSSHTKLDFWISAEGLRSGLKNKDLSVYSVSRNVGRNGQAASECLSVDRQPRDESDCLVIITIPVD